MISGKNLIAGVWKASGNTRYRTFNPLLNTENENGFVEATTDEIAEAATAAWMAFKEFRKVPDANRADFLDTIAEEIEALGDELIDTYMKESGLPEGRARGERGRTMGQLKSFAEMLRSSDWRKPSLDEAIPDRSPAPKPDLRKTHIPLGPVAVFGSSNFPLAYSTAGGDTASALAAGCPVIVKSHPMHAGTGELIAAAVLRAVEKTGMPKGVFSNLNSKGIEVGVQLVKHPKIKAVGFTGSIKGGRALYDLANSRPVPIPVFAEMGSINPVIISEGMLKSENEKWAKSYASSINLGTGQFCTNPGLILAVQAEGLQQFKDVLAKTLTEQASQVMLHPNIHSAYENGKQEVLLQQNVERLSIGVQVSPNFAEQAVVAVSGSDFLANPKLHQEVFGPFSIIVACKDEAELLQIIENLEGQLTGTILANEDELEGLGTVIEELAQRVGRIIFNGVPTGVEVCPSMNHGGPYPASTDSRFTAVGLDAVNRWIRPLSYQNFPVSILPKELKNG